MAFTLSFPTSGPLPGAEDIAAWLTEQGEPFGTDGPSLLVLRALPVRLVFDSEGAVKAQVDLNSTVPLTRLVGLLFDLSIRLGADVRLAGAGRVNRTDLWLRLADEQDRVRLCEALSRAEQTGDSERVVTQLWSLLCSIGRGRDLRWDTARGCIVHMQEVGAPGGISLEDAAWHVDSPQLGDLVGLPVTEDVHILAWRWVTEAWPRLTAE